jgi:phospholipase/carboxylesterase
MTVRFTFPALMAGARQAEAAERNRADAALVPARQPTGGMPGLAVGGVEIFVPELYEPNYAYPLVVWLVPSVRRQGELRRLMRRLSDRNYFGLALTCDAPDVPEWRLCEAVSQLRRRWNLHTERIVLAGQGELATGALQFALSRPEWFQGVIALSPLFERLPRLLSRFDAVRGRRVFLAENASDPGTVAEALQRLQQLLWAAGLSVAACRSESRQPLGDALLGAINHWLISGIEQPEPVG